MNTLQEHFDRYLRNDKRVFSISLHNCGDGYIILINKGVRAKRWELTFDKKFMADILAVKLTYIETNVQIQTINQWHPDENIKEGQHKSVYIFDHDTINDLITKLEDKFELELPELWEGT